jgi:hypothetical protein
MTTMIALIGEQPIPNLLPAKYFDIEELILVCSNKTEKVANRLMKLVDNSHKLKVPPFNFDELLGIFKDKLTQGDLIFNLTGGTKMMAVAAYAIAAQKQSPFLYLDSQEHKSLLSKYDFRDGIPSRTSKKELPSLISIKEYLNAHLDNFHVTGFSNKKGGDFEKEVYEILNSDKSVIHETMSGVRPKTQQKQDNRIEIDFVIRHNNQVGIIEVKDSKNKPKKALDQLAMAGGREYLGIYTTKFVVTSHENIYDDLKPLAKERGIHIIEIPSYIRGKSQISPSDKEKLIITIKTQLCGK